MFILKYFLILIVFYLHKFECFFKKDEITNLHGLNWPINFKHFSGYLSAGKNKYLHYWYVTSQRNPAKDPVVLWLNGGPGCSSLDGLLSEHGPYLINDDGETLRKNNYSWNLVSNVLYLESPVGVGFSYDTDKNYTTSDDEVSLGNYKALKNFFEIYSEFKENDFYITGESYGGVYVPTLALRLSKDLDINFKGFAIGNGLSSYVLNLNSLVYFAYDHGLIGENLYLKFVGTCCSNSNATIGNCDFSNSLCLNLVDQMFAILDTLNIYNLYAKCYHDNNNGKKNYNLRKRFFEYDKYFKNNKNSFSKVSSEPPSISVPCLDDRAITKYLNNKFVRSDLHIPESIKQWSICSELDYQRNYQSMYMVYKQLISLKKYRILIYNGDVDMACNFLGDQWFVQSLGLKKIGERTMWAYDDPDDHSSQIGGFLLNFDGLSFVTFKGAGHMVPQDKPLQSLNVYKAFIANKMEKLI